MRTNVLTFLWSWNVHARNDRPRLRLNPFFLLMFVMLIGCSEPLHPERPEHGVALSHSSSPPAVEVWGTRKPVLRAGLSADAAVTFSEAIRRISREEQADLLYAPLEEPRGRWVVTVFVGDPDVQDALEAAWSSLDAETATIMREMAAEARLRTHGPSR